MRHEKHTPNNIRLMVVLILVIALGVCTLGKILHLVIWERSLYDGTSEERCLDMTQEGWESSPLAHDPNCNCFVKKMNVVPTRGNIYADDGKILAGNFTIFSVTLDGRALQPKGTVKVELPDGSESTLPNDTIYCGKRRTDWHFSRSGAPDQLNKLIDTLATAFYQHFKVRLPNFSYDYYKKKFTEAIKNGTNQQILPCFKNIESRWITVDDTAFIKTLPLLCRARNGLNCTPHSIRINPYGDLARRTIGVYIPDERANGLESAFNSALYGEDGAKKWVVVNKALIPLRDKTYPKDGNDINTTINLEMQNIVHNELQQMLSKQDAEWGCAVVMETKTGEVKAISNLTRVAEDVPIYKESGRNHALMSMVEPGSTFKLASLLAYLESTPERSDTAARFPIMAHTFTKQNRNGKAYKYPKVDKPGAVEGVGSPIEIFARSSNVGITSMVFSIFPNSFTNYLNKIDAMFITTTFVTQFKIPSKRVTPDIKRTARDFHTYYNTCFGAGFKMTPMQTLVYYNAIANGGTMVEPLFVKSISSQGKELERFETNVIAEQICKPSTVERAQKFLRAVVTNDHGTARKYRNFKYPFAGKTGTRDIWIDGGYDKNKNSVSFCGYFPADDPQYSCIVFIYKVSKHSDIAVDVFARINEQIMTLEEYSGEEIDKTMKTMPSFGAVSEADLPLILEGYGFNASNIPSAPYLRRSGNTNKQPLVVPAPYDSKAKLPDVRGMNAADATFELNKAGYQVVIEGKGYVKHQTEQQNKTVLLQLSM